MGEGYNGYANYETWLVNLWLDNSQADQDWWSERTQAAIEAAESEPCARGAAIGLLSTELREFVEEMASETKLDGLLSDLLNAAIAAVNWEELARNYIDAAKEER